MTIDELFDEMLVASFNVSWFLDLQVGNNQYYGCLQAEEWTAVIFLMGDGEAISRQAYATTRQDSLRKLRALMGNWVEEAMPK